MAGKRTEGTTVDFFPLLLIMTIIPEKFSLNQILFVLFFYIDWTSYELCLLLKIKLVVLVPLKNISGPIFQTYVSITFVEKNMINLQND